MDIDARFVELARAEGDPVGGTDLPGDVPSLLPRRPTPASVQARMGEAYLDVSQAAYEHGFSSTCLAVSLAAWERLVQGCSADMDDMGRNLAALVHSARSAAVEAMVDGGAQPFTAWAPEAPGSRRAVLTDLEARFFGPGLEDGCEDPLVLVDLAHA
ncbi:hypothetical protein Bequi_09855 [Brachybacterium sp. JHP9]|uniref:Uncharacterized protein n=1 Tax=Brachybacterium equifaecis TaxID=2910770 RepID=A0ABT0R1A4_9MICO|nr:hypothetical protein [Brachybacterium equifaecis]